jgi:hypothetical protein
VTVLAKWPPVETGLCIHTVSTRDVKLRAIRGVRSAVLAPQRAQHGCGARVAFERAQRVKAMDRVRTRLEKLQRRVVDGRLKADDLAAPGAPLSRCRGQSVRVDEYKPSRRRIAPIPPTSATPSVSAKHAASSAP